EAIKDDYSAPKEFLLKVQQLENIEKLVELRQISINASTTKQQPNEPVIKYYYDMMELCH
ncbi:unnamed protein product, partial [Rotaria sp. Silwood2]